MYLYSISAFPVGERGKQVFALMAVIGSPRMPSTDEALAQLVKHKRVPAGTVLSSVIIRGGTDEKPVFIKRAVAPEISE